MTANEMITKLQEKTNASYEDAKVALETTNWDILDAILVLERQGKVASPSSGNTDNPRYTVHSEYSSSSDTTNNKMTKEAGNMLSKIGNVLLSVVNFLCRNGFEIAHHENSMIQIPIIVLVLLIIFLFWPTIAILIIGLFFDFRYALRGPNLGKLQFINNALEKASEFARNLVANMKK